MTAFVKYMHLERFGTSEVEGIETGKTYVFPKLDGTNGQVWLDNGIVCAGSRNRVLSLDADNAGFLAWVIDQVNIKEYLSESPNHTLYGEWLVHHSLKTYRDDEWRRFYVFDVFDHSRGVFLEYDAYKGSLDRHAIDYLPPIAIVRNGTYDKYLSCLEKATFGIKDGHGIGEGVVIKNYDFQNKYGRVVWAKIVTTAFKEEHQKAMGAAEIGGLSTEEKIVADYVTQHGIDKCHAKIALQNEGWNSRMIPQLLGMVWHDLITEEIWDILKKHKNPKIDFAALNRFCIARVKELRRDLF
jgi:hypothetical protein